MPFHRLPVHLIALLTIVAACPSAGADETPKPRGEKVTLQLNLKEGDKKTLVQRNEVKSTVSFNDQTVESVVKMGMYLSNSVEKVDADKLHTLKLTYERITLDVMSPLATMSYDSKQRQDSAPRPELALLDALVGESVTMDVTRQGETKEIRGIEELSKKLSAKAPAGANVQQQLDAMKQALEQFTAYPEGPVDIGESWSRKTKLAFGPGMQMDLDAKYTLADRKDGKAVIKVDGKLSLGSGMKGTSTGRITMDEASGWIIGGEMDTEVVGEVSGASISVKGKASISEK